MAGSASSGRRGMRSCVSILGSMLLCAFAVLGASPAHAAPVSGGEASLKAFLEGMQSLTADFTQSQSDERGEQISSSSGRMQLARPGRFRWNYESPYPQLIVCDGSKIWLYDPDLAQVTVRPAAEALAGTPAALLAQNATLSDEFDVQQQERQGNAEVLRLTPKSPDTDFKSVDLWLERGLPQRMIFLDTLGNRTDIAFSNLKANTRIPDAEFRFTPPKGVEVVEGQTHK